MPTYCSSIWEKVTPFTVEKTTNETLVTPGIHEAGRQTAGRLARGTYLNFPVRTCSALIPHRWAPLMSPTMSSPIMMACRAVSERHSEVMSRQFSSCAASSFLT